MLCPARGFRQVGGAVGGVLKDRDECKVLGQLAI